MNLKDENELIRLYEIRNSIYIEIHKLKELYSTYNSHQYREYSRAINYTELKKEFNKLCNKYKNIEDSIFNIKQIYNLKTKSRLYKIPSLG